MQIGLFSRDGRYLRGRIGNLDLAWDRHEGGRLSTSYLVAGESIPIGCFTIHATLEDASLSSACDPDPHLIPAEAGPQRLSMRAVQRLSDVSGRHIGDAMQESWAWADGDLYLNAMLRLIDPGRGGRLTAAYAGFAFGEGWRNAEADCEDGNVRLVHDSGIHLAVAQYGGDTPWAVSFSDVSPWEPLDGQPPYYRRWGPYYDQWGGTGGWASLDLSNASGTGPVLRACWVRDEMRTRGPAEAFQGTLALLAAGDSDALERKIRAFGEPLMPAVEGGLPLYHSPMEGTTVVRKTGEPLRVTFLPDPEGRTVRLHVCGAEGREALYRKGENDSPAWPLTLGGVSDDPNGPDLLRPDDPHGPILTDGDVRPDEAIAVCSLHPERETEIAFVPSPGLQLAWQKWDERQNLVLFSSAHPQGRLMELSLRDLKARYLRIPGHRDSAMAHLPLYWFQANAASAHHCLNCPGEVEVLENGPDAVRFRVLSQNPAGTALSEMNVRIPFLQNRLQIDMICAFEAVGTWDLPEVQYCNFFPEETRYPDAWNADRVLVMAADGRMMRLDPAARSGSQVQAGERFRYYDGALFVALYGGPKGNLFALSRPRDIGAARPGYQLCGCWLDNHLFLSGGGEEIPAGTRYEVALSLVMAHTTNIDDDVEALGRRALASGEIAL